jgi:hypothetical protein
MGFVSFHLQARLVESTPVERLCALTGPSLEGSLPLLPLFGLSLRSPSKPQSPPLAPGSAQSVLPASAQIAHHHSCILESKRESAVQENLLARPQKSG